MIGRLLLGKLYILTGSQKAESRQCVNRRAYYRIRQSKANDILETLMIYWMCESLKPIVAETDHPGDTKLRRYGICMESQTCHPTLAPVSLGFY